MLSGGAGEPASTCAVCQGLYKQECCPQGQGRVGQPIRGAAGSSHGQQHRAQPGSQDKEQMGQEGGEGSLWDV